MEASVENLLLSEKNDKKLSFPFKVSDPKSPKILGKFYILTNLEVETTNYSFCLIVFDGYFSFSTGTNWFFRVRPFRTQ